MDWIRVQEEWLSEMLSILSPFQLIVDLFGMQETSGTSLVDHSADLEAEV